MPTTLPLTCVLCGLRFTSGPLLDLHIREDHERRRAPEGDDDDRSLCPRRDGRPAGAAETARLQRLLREATAARRALGETEDALARLPDGSFGRCQQCSGSIPTTDLLAEPETRYCAECIAVSWVALAG
jgi:RNA polymerase-binding transcription factor DksA